MPDNKPKYGGGAMFVNNTACKYFPWDEIKRKQDARDTNPELSGSVEINKAFVKKLVEMFKNGNTQESQRGDTAGQEVVIMDIAGLHRISAKLNKKTGEKTQYFSVWFSDEYKSKEEASPSSDNVDDDIPF